MVKDLKTRLKLYLEIGLVSVVWLGLLLGSASFFATVVMDDSDKAWAIVLALTPVMLLPYLVVAAAVWGVNLRAMGAGAERAVVEPPPGTIDMIE